MEEANNINSDDQDAKTLLAADIDGDGAAELVQADFDGDDKDGMAAYEINGTEIMNEAGIQDGYRDFAAFDWGTSLGPRVA